MVLAVPTIILELLDFLFNPVNLEFGCGLLVGIAYLNRERLATLGEFFARFIAVQALSRLQLRFPQH